MRCEVEMGGNSTRSLGSTSCADHDLQRVEVTDSFGLDASILAVGTP